MELFNVLGNATPDPFGSALKKASTTEKSGSKKNDKIVEIDDPEVSQSVDNFLRAHQIIKQAEAEKSETSSVIKEYCVDVYLDDFANNGVKPATMKFKNTKGNMVTLVVQDRGGRYDVSDEQLSTLKAMVGEDKIESLVSEDTEFKFNNEILNKSGVMEALGAKIQELAQEGVISDNDASNIISAERKRTVKKGTLDKLATICNNDRNLMGSVISALSPHVSEYVKP